jgi:acyl CoA:acetate/3-ketoacid CoA transferase
MPDVTEGIELAEGADVVRDVLGQVESPVRVSPALRPMDPGCSGPSR